MPSVSSLRARAAPTGQQADGFGREQGRGFLGVDHGEAARLASAGGDFCHQPVCGKAHRDGHADLFLDRASKAGQHDGGGGAVQGFSAGQIKHGFVNRQRLDQGRELVQQRPDLAGGRGVFRKVWLYNDGVGAGPQCLEHRHGAFHPVDTGDIAGRGYNAPGATADDDRL